MTASPSAGAGPFTVGQAVTTETGSARQAIATGTCGLAGRGVSRRQQKAGRGMGGHWAGFGSGLAGLGAWAQQGCGRGSDFDFGVRGWTTAQHQPGGSARLVAAISARIRPVQMVI